MSSCVILITMKEGIFMEDFIGKLLVVVSVSYLAFHVIVDLILK
jgi:hypothetical protein